MSIAAEAGALAPVRRRPARRETARRGAPVRAASLLALGGVLGAAENESPGS